MSYKTKCPVCDEPFKRRISTKGSMTLNVSDTNEICVSTLYDRICVH